VIHAWPLSDRRSTLPANRFFALNFVASVPKNTPTERATRQNHFRLPVIQAQSRGRQSEQRLRYLLQTQSCRAVGRWGGALLISVRGERRRKASVYCQKLPFTPEHFTTFYVKWNGSVVWRESRLDGMGNLPFPVF
jgi:hypothetical protein